MNATMKVPMTGNPDADFVAVMIPHHQGAVDMAKVELQYGKEPRIAAAGAGHHRLADQEIAEMRRWQARHGRKHAQ